VSRLIGRLEESVIAFLLAAMTLLTFAQVVLRYVFNSGFVWALEASTYLFGWLVLFGMSYGVKVGSHIGVDALVKLLPLWGRRAAGLFAALLCMVYAAILFKGSLDYVEKMHIIGVEAEDLPIERWILLLILPIGFAMLFFRLAQVAWRIWSGRQTGFTLANEAAETVAHLGGGQNPHAGNSHTGNSHSGGARP
jgi:C4-dicarboxylate transporter DctQ subunit